MAWTDLMKSLPLRTNRFGIEPELTARLAQAGARIYEVPISYSGRTYEEGKKIGWRDGVAALWHIVRANVFAPAVPRFDGAAYFRTRDAARATLQTELASFGALRGSVALHGDIVAPDHDSWNQADL
jgi:hypothetical protein